MTTSIGDMAYNIAKLVVCGVLVIALVVAILVDSDSATWATPLLGLLVGYCIGNSQITSGQGSFTPIVQRPQP